MSALSVNSINNAYVQTSVAQQRVAADRANVRKSETQLKQDQAQLDKDLTYLSTLQRKTQTVQNLEGSQAQDNALKRLSGNAQAAQQASQQAANTLASVTSTASTVGTNVNTVA